MVQVLLLTLTSFIAMPAAKAQVCVGDSLALVEIYNATNGPSWTSSTNWLTGRVATWRGVSVTGNRVTGLSLPFNHLTGALPYHLGFLQELTTLSLQGNDLAGQIPSALVFLQKLKVLNLSSNNLTGNIPVTLGLTLSLTSLNLSGNTLSGSIPVTFALLSKLRALDLSSNQLSGSIPATLGYLSSLQSLSLANNKLSGSIPATFSNLNSVQEVYIFNNKLSGALPDAIGGMDSLTFFNASQNKFTGAVPASVAALPFLYFFNVESNQIQDLPNLTSSASLLQLYVADNKLTFADIVPNISKAQGGNYAPQDSVASNKTINVCAGQTLTLPGNYIEATPGNLYRWYKTDLSYFGPLSVNQPLAVPNAATTNAGVYTVEISNDQAPDLLIYRKTVRVKVNACASSAQALRTGDTKVYPVPFDETTLVEVAGEAAKVVVMDSQGNIRETHATTDDQQSVTVGASLTKGTYFVQSVHGSKKEVVRIVKN